MQQDIEVKTKEAFIKQCYKLKEIQLEFDWGEVKLFISQNLKQSRWGHYDDKGNYRYRDLYFSQKMENFLHLNVRIFEHVGGVYKEIVYDNLRERCKIICWKKLQKPTDDLLKLSIY